MSRSAEPTLTPILAALSGPGVEILKAAELVPAEAGLYAIFGGDDVWKELGLGPNPDGRPLYVGKAESSLRDRDLRQHFANGRTGSSTLRRSFAALLRDRLHLHAVPRNPSKPAYFANYGLSPRDDAKLTAWMSAKLSISVWAWDGVIPLNVLESRVLAELMPPLNLSGIMTSSSAMLSARRAVMASEAKAWRPSR